MFRIVKYPTPESFKLAFDGLCEWDDIEVIANILTNKLDAVLVNKLDGPYSRHWDYKTGDLMFELNYDEDLGVCLRPSTQTTEGYEFLNNLAEKIVEHI